jgi:hypothetical protein
MQFLIVVGGLDGQWLRARAEIQNTNPALIEPDLDEIAISMIDALGFRRKP